MIVQAILCDMTKTVLRWNLLNSPKRPEAWIQIENILQSRDPKICQEEYFT